MRNRFAAIFDLDGTLLNTLTDLTNSVNYALQSCALPTRSESHIRNFIGNGIRKTLERAMFPLSDSIILDRLYLLFYEYYTLHCLDNTKPYDGIPELLSLLREKKYELAVVSNKANAQANELTELFFNGIFSLTVGETATVPRKPAPDMLHIVLNKLNVPAAQAVYIGDSVVDIQTAANTGLDSILVSWGYGDISRLIEAGAQCIALAPDEIPNLLECYRLSITQ